MKEQESQIAINVAAPLKLLDFSLPTWIKTTEFTTGKLLFRTIIFPIVLYGCGTWSRTLREERRLRVFENRVLRRVFGPKRDEVTGEWRKLHNEELSDLGGT